MKKPVILSIAASDSSAGAGTQADLKTISALGGYGVSVLSALTAQNTQGVLDIYPIPPSFLEQQFRAVFSDFSVDAIKIGLIPSGESLKCIASVLKDTPAPFTVYDPVLRSSSGFNFLCATDLSSLNLLSPCVTLLTPNLDEAAHLLKTHKARCVEEMAEQAYRLVVSGWQSVLVKGGHCPGDTCTDVLVIGGDRKIFFFQEKRFFSKKRSHGTGCALSSAIATYKAKGYPLQEAILKAKTYITRILSAEKKDSPGHGDNLLDHFA